jgi:hypothetical protein
MQITSPNQVVEIDTYSRHISTSTLDYFEKQYRKRRLTWIDIVHGILSSPDTKLTSDCVDRICSYVDEEKWDKTKCTFCQYNDIKSNLSSICAECINAMEEVWFPPGEYKVSLNEFCKHVPPRKLFNKRPFPLYRRPPPKTYTQKLMSDFFSMESESDENTNQYQ